MSLGGEEAHEEVLCVFEKGDGTDMPSQCLHFERRENGEWVHKCVKMFDLSMSGSNTSFDGQRIDVVIWADFPAASPGDISVLRRETEHTYTRRFPL